METWFSVTKVMLKEPLNFEYHLHRAYLASNSNRPVKDAMHAQDGRLRRVDDGCSKQRSKYSTIADGECTTIHVLNGKLILASLK